MIRTISVMCCKHNTCYTAIIVGLQRFVKIYDSAVVNETITVERGLLKKDGMPPNEVVQKTVRKAGVSVLPMPVIIEGRTCYEGRKPDPEVIRIKGRWASRAIQ